MAPVNDVAAYILENNGPMTTMKLQKLLYYCQAWSLVWDEAPLFNDRIEAWANGPVVPSIYQHLRGTFKVHKLGAGNAESLNANQRETVDAVLDYYGDETSQWLSDLTHREDPWKDARRGLSPAERSNKVITWASMAEYYGSL